MIKSMVKTVVLACCFLAQAESVKKNQRVPHPSPAFATGDFLRFGLGCRCDVRDQLGCGYAERIAPGRRATMDALISAVHDRNWQNMDSTVERTLKPPTTTAAPVGIEDQRVLWHPNRDVQRVVRESIVMIVSSEPSMVKRLHARLDSAGYAQVLPVSKTDLGLDLMSEFQPDVVLLELSSADSAGLKLLGRIRSIEDFRHVPVVAIISVEDRQARTQALQLGITEFLANPVDEQELILRLRNVVVAKRFLDQHNSYDRVTGLANRRLFVDRLKRSLRMSDRDGCKSALLLLQIDGLRKIHSEFGQLVAEELLNSIARRLESLVRAKDLVCHPDSGASQMLLARIGGDQFTLLLTDIRQSNDALGVAERIVAEISNQFEIRKRKLQLTASIGIAVYHTNQTDSELLLKQAEVAMTAARRNGQNKCQIYSEQLDRSRRSSLALRTGLHQALERSEFVLHYQPKVDIRSGYVSGAETLVRWTHPQRGLIPPNEFISLAEQSGLIREIGDYVLREACHQNAVWMANSLDGLQVAVNVSGFQLRDREFVGMVRRAIDDTGLPPHYLTLEFTQRVLLEDAKDNIDVLHSLKDIGVRLSADDFVTGYSALSYLEQFPLDELKIDRMFINKISTEADRTSIVSAIIAMAHSLRFSLVAEGVETAEQLDYLRRNHCESYQGFLFSKPLAADEFAELAAVWRP